MIPLAAVALDLVAIAVLAFAVYYPRHRRRDLAVAFVGVNVGVLAVSMVLACGGAAFGGVITAAGFALAAASGRTLERNLTIGAVAGYVLFVILNVLAGVALGALLQSSAPAVAATVPSAALATAAASPIRLVRI